MRKSSYTLQVASCAPLDGLCSMALEVGSERDHAPWARSNSRSRSSAPLKSYCASAFLNLAAAEIKSEQTLRYVVEIPPLLSDEEWQENSQFSQSDPSIVPILSTAWKTTSRCQYNGAKMGRHT